MKLSREKFLAAAMALSAISSACSKDPKVTADGTAKQQNVDINSPSFEGGLPAPAQEGSPAPSPVAEGGPLPAPALEVPGVLPASPVIEGLPAPVLPIPAQLPSQLPPVPPVQIPQGLPKPG
jgi:hypothetical protein